MFRKVIFAKGLLPSQERPEFPEINHHTQLFPINHIPAKKVKLMTTSNFM